MMLSPGDFIAEVKLVWTKLVASSEKDLYLAFVKGVNCRETFGTSEELAPFIEYIKENGGSSNMKVSTDYKGKRLHSAVAISLKSLSREIQRRLVKSVSTAQELNSLTED